MGIVNFLIPDCRAIANLPKGIRLQPGAIYSRQTIYLSSMFVLSEILIAAQTNHNRDMLRTEIMPSFKL